MNSTDLRLPLCAVILLLPLSLFAQDPMSSSPSQSQGQITPSVPRQGDLNSMQDSGPNAGDVGQIMKDKIFLRTATASGIAEVLLGQLASQKAGSDEVRIFGQKMVEDHARIDRELAPIADSMGARLPKSMSKEDQAEHDKLNNLSGSDFDAEYLAFMVREHHKDLREFRGEAASTTDPTLRDVVQRAAIVIHDHMLMVEKLAHDKGVPLPPHRSSQGAPATALR